MPKEIKDRERKFVVVIAYDTAALGEAVLVAFDHQVAKAASEELAGDIGLEAWTEKVPTAVSERMLNWYTIPLEDLNAAPFHV